MKLGNPGSDYLPRQLPDQLRPSLTDRSETAASRCFCLTTALRTIRTWSSAMMPQHFVDQARRTYLLDHLSWTQINNQLTDLWKKFLIRPGVDIPYDRINQLIGHSPDNHGDNPGTAAKAIAAALYYVASNTPLCRMSCQALFGARAHCHGTPTNPDYPLEIVGGLLCGYQSTTNWDRRMDAQRLIGYAYGRWLCEFEGIHLIRTYIDAVGLDLDPLDSWQREVAVHDIASVFAPAVFDDDLYRTHARNDWENADEFDRGLAVLERIISRWT